MSNRRPCFPERAFASRRTQFRHSPTGTLNLTASYAGWSRYLSYNVTAPVEFLGDFSVTGNGDRTFTFSGGCTLPAGATTITSTGSSRAVFTGG